MATKVDKVALIVRVEPDIAERVRQAAHAERRSVSNFGAIALEIEANRVIADSTPVAA